MNDSQPSVEINVRATRYFIAQTRHACRHCDEQTDVFALAVAPGHETLDVDEETEDAAAAEDAFSADAWTLAAHHALLFHIEFLNATVQARLASLTRTFRIDQLDSAAPAWANHCGACGAWLDDEELFCEPGEAFFPTSETSAAAIRLLPIEEAFEAATGGYSFDPNFFYAMSRE